jgi:hypothetical protein
MPVKGSSLISQEYLLNQGVMKRFWISDFRLRN